MDIVCCFVYLLKFYILTSNVISGQVPTCDDAYSWRYYSAASLGNQADSLTDTDTDVDTENCVHVKPPAPPNCGTNVGSAASSLDDYKANPAGILVAITRSQACEYITIIRYT